MGDVTYCPSPNSLGGHTFESTPPKEAVCVQCGVVFVPSYVPDDNPDFDLLLEES